MGPQFPARLVTVGTAQLRIGMYVAELDRSWLHTPFQAPGLLITDQSQIEELRRLCEYVYIDPLLSQQDEADQFTTGLTARLHTLPAQTPVDRARVQLRNLAQAIAVMVRAARRPQPLALAPVRQALGPLTASLLQDPDTLTWLMATELKVGLLHRRALGCATLMIRLGHRLGFDRNVVEELGLAGLLLDIGKVAVPVTILAKPDRLSDQERHFVERHVRRGLYLVRSSAIVPEVLQDAVLGHHERLDGSGYPRGIVGTQLPLPARLAGIVDTYDALTQDRRYASAAAPHDAVRLVNSMRGSQFDATIVRTFVRMLGLYPTGSWVQLADGRLGIVRGQVPDEPLRPRVALVADSAGRPLDQGEPLWRPARRGDISRALPAAAVAVSRRVLQQAVDTATHLAA